MGTFWIVHGHLITPQGIVKRTVQVRDGHIVAIGSQTPRGAQTINLQSGYLAPGFIDLHVWGDPQAVAAESVKHGTTAFLTTLVPARPADLVKQIAASTKAAAAVEVGAQCLGLHLEGPFLNPVRGGVLPKRDMRAPTVRELSLLARAGDGRLKLITMAPELPGAAQTIRWCKAHRVVVSLGHSDADAQAAQQAIRAGAKAVTHIFNGMRPCHHRHPSLLDVALTDPALAAMVIADGVHVSAEALRLLLRAKGPQGVILVTDSVRLQARAWNLHLRQGAYYDRRNVLAGSALTMADAVRNMVHFAGASLVDAVRMATENPARLLGCEQSMGAIAIGRRADLVWLNKQLRVRATFVGGRTVHLN